MVAYTTADNLIEHSGTHASRGCRKIGQRIALEALASSPVANKFELCDSVALAWRRQSRLISTQDNVAAPGTEQSFRIASDEPHRPTSQPFDPGTASGIGERPSAKSVSESGFRH